MIMFRDELKEIVRQLLIEEGEDATEEMVQSGVVMLDAISQLRRTGEEPTIPIEKLGEYVDGTLSDDERHEIEQQLDKSPAARADLEMVRAMPPPDVVMDSDAGVPEEVGRRMLKRIKEAIAREEYGLQLEDEEWETLPFVPSSGAGAVAGPEEVAEPREPEEEGAITARLTKLLATAASWLGPAILALQECRELLFVTQAKGPVFMGAPPSVEGLPEIDWWGGTLGIKTERAGESPNWAQEAWVLDQAGRILYRSSLDEHGLARFKDLPPGKYRLNTDRGIGKIRGRMTA